MGSAFASSRAALPSGGGKGVGRSVAGCSTVARTGATRAGARWEPTGRGVIGETSGVAAGAILAVGLCRVATCTGAVYHSRARAAETTTASAHPVRSPAPATAGGATDSFPRDAMRRGLCVVPTDEPAPDMHARIMSLRCSHTWPVLTPAKGSKPVVKPRGIAPVATSTGASQAWRWGRRGYCQLGFAQWAAV
jgi:hypothetical protein